MRQGIQAHLLTQGPISVSSELGHADGNTGTPISGGDGCILFVPTSCVACVVHKIVNGGSNAIDVVIVLLKMIVVVFVIYVCEDKDYRVW